MRAIVLSSSPFWRPPMAAMLRQVEGLDVVECDEPFEVLGHVPADEAVVTICDSSVSLDELNGLCRALSRRSPGSTLVTLGRTAEAGSATGLDLKVQSFESPHAFVEASAACSELVERIEQSKARTLVDCLGLSSPLAPKHFESLLAQMREKPYAQIFNSARHLPQTQLEQECAVLIESFRVMHAGDKDSTLAGKLDELDEALRDARASLLIEEPSAEGR